MACTCASDLQERIKKEDQNVQLMVEAVIDQGRSILLKEDFIEDGPKNLLMRTILFLIEIINNNKTKEVTKSSNKEVETIQQPKLIEVQTNKVDSKEKSEVVIEEEFEKKEI